MAAKMIHSMIRVLDEERAVSFYEQAFGLHVADRLDFDSFTLVYMKNDQSHFELELTINKDRSEPYNLGDGYGHLAFVVEDLKAEHDRFQSLNLNPRKIVEFNHDGKPVAKFFFVTDPDGYEIEVLEKGGRFQ